MGSRLTKEEIQAALNERHSPEVQDMLTRGKVAIAGLGGLGSNVAYALTRIGVGHLHLVDFDRVDITNLNRQQYFMEDIGKYKTDALEALLRKINPYLDIQTDCVRVTEKMQRSCFRMRILSVKPSIIRRQRPCWSMRFWKNFRKRSWCQPQEWRDLAAVTQS